MILIGLAVLAYAYRRNAASGNVAEAPTPQGAAALGGRGAGAKA
jgi:hypothetical protein